MEGRVFVLMGSINGTVVTATVLVSVSIRSTGVHAGRVEAQPSVSMVGGRATANTVEGQPSVYMGGTNATAATAAAMVYANMEDGR